jgi:predicted thioesterase
MEDQVMNFRTKILEAGKTATGIEVPAKIVNALGAGKKPPVRITINGYTYRNTVAVMGGKFMVSVSADVREAAGVAGGDTVDVNIEWDDQPRDVSVPPELVKFLTSNAKAKTLFQTLSYSKKRLLTIPIENGKTTETRQRNLEKAIDSLKKGGK